MIRPVFFGFVAALMATPTLAQEFKAGDLVIEQPWSRATPKGAPVGGAWLKIHNNGKVADRLVGASSDIAGDVQVHEMSMDNGVMKMRHLDKGLEIPAGATVELKPGGYHLMLMKLAKPLTQGDTIHITLEFENAGKAAVDFKVGGMGDTSAAGSHGGMSMDHGAMDMKH